MTDQTDKLTTLTTNVARLLDGALALPADADRDGAAENLSFELRHELDMFDAEPKHFGVKLSVCGVEITGMPAGETSLELNALDALDLPEGDLAAKVIAREQNVEADNDAYLRNPPQQVAAPTPEQVERAHAMKWLADNADRIASILRGEPDMETAHMHNHFEREVEVQVKRDKLAADLVQIAAKLA